MNSLTKRISACCLALLMAASVSVSSVSALADSTTSSVADSAAEETSAVVTINDENLRKAICTALGKDYVEGVEITQADMESLTELDASNSDISDIEGLQYAINLEKLDLSYTKIASSQRFANIEGDYFLKMTKLKYLNVSGCGQYATSKTKYWFDDIIRNIGALGEFETLKASDNNLKGQIYLSSNMTYQSLKTLDLSNNYLTALLVSSGTLNKEMFPNIEKIDLRGNGFYLDESSEGYSGYVNLGIDKFDFSDQRNLANLYAVYVRELGSTSTLVNQYCPYYLCDENGVFDLGTVYSDSITCALKGETCGIATTKAEVNGEKYTVVCGYSNNFDADRTQITLSDFKDGENEVKVNVMNINGDTAEYVIKFNKADVPASESEDDAGVKDPALYAAVMNKLGNTDYSHIITKDEMASLSGTLQVNDVTSADGVEYAVNLTTLRINGTFSDFPDISGLTALTELKITSSEMTRIPDISSLENLKVLALSAISEENWDISGFSKLTQLTIGQPSYENTMVMPKGISKLEKLSSISIYGSNVKAITERPNRTGNVYVRLYGCRNLKDISGLSGAAKLTFDARDCCYIDFSTLNNVSALTMTLTDIDNEIKLSGFGENVVLTSFSKTGGNGLDETDLIAAAAESLTSVTYKNNAVNELPSSIYDCKNLATLSVTSCPIEYLSDDIGNLTSLNKLVLSTTSLTDLPEGAGKLDNLTSIDLKSSHMESLPQAIFGMESLKTLKANWSDFLSIDGDWGKLQNLENIEIESCGIYEIPDNLKEASALKSIDLMYNPISRIKDDAFDGLENLTSVKLGYYLKSNYNYDTRSFDITDNDAITAVNKLKERGVSVYSWLPTTLSQLLRIETSAGNINYKTHTDDQATTFYVPSGTETFDIMPVAAKSDTVITVNGDTVMSSETVTIGDLQPGNNNILISCKNECTPMAGTNPQTINYTVNVFVGDFVSEDEFPTDKHTYIVEGKILKENDNTESMAASYMENSFKVKYANGKYAVDLSVKNNGWIPSMRYLDLETGEYVSAEKVSEDMVNNTAVWRLYTDNLNKELYISPYVTPMGYSPVCRIVFDTNKITDITDTLPAVDLSDLNIAINKALAITEKYNVYTDESYGNMLTALETAQEVAASALSTQDEADSAEQALTSAIEKLEIDESKLADKTALKAAIDEASALEKGSHTDTAWNALQEAISDVQSVYDTVEARQSEVDSAVKALNTAVTLFKSSGEASKLDKNNLADGVYSIYADMIKLDRESKSMADNAINHTVKLEVKDGKYYVTLDFRGITIENRFGYLKNLSYYLDGYTYNEFGVPKGTLADAEVVSTQKDSDGNDIIDQYNDADNLYPDIVTFELVPSAIADEDGYVPLHVFVPIMEAIAAGNGDQDVLMKIDWSTLTKTTADDPGFQPEDPVEQSPELDYTDTATGVKIHADKGVFDEGVTAVIRQITEGADYNSAESALSSVGTSFKLYDVSFVNTDGAEVEPNGKVMVSIPVPNGFTEPAVYRIIDGKKVLMSGTVTDGMYTFATKTSGEYAIVNARSDDNSGTSFNSSSGSSAGNNSSKSSSGTNTANPATGAAGAASAAAALALGAVVVSKKRKGK